MEDIWAEYPFEGADVDITALENLTSSIEDLEKALMKQTNSDGYLGRANETSSLNMTITIDANSAYYSETKNNIKTKYQWVNAGDPFTVKGTKINCGLIYVGTGNEYNREDSSFIDPSLTVSNQADKAGQQMGYWPTYKGIRPVERRAYLDWLSGGRNDPEIGIGYVFLFFYGLERRAFIDKSISEYGVLIDEVNRLKRIYGENNSFKRYSENFINNLTLLATSSKIEKPKISQEMRYGYEMPTTTMIFLGNKIKSSKCIDADDGLIWLLSSPVVYLRTPANRCFEEFKQLWKIRFEEKYQSGMKVTIPKRKLKLNYRSASGFYSEIEISKEYGDVPDISGLNSPVEKLKDLANECTDQLDAYSRYLGRSSEKQNEVIALSHLPKELLAIQASGLTKLLVSHFEKSFTEDLGQKVFRKLLVSELLELTKLNAGKAPDKSSFEAFSNISGKLGYGFEPDSRFGSFIPQGDEKIILFKTEAKSDAVVNSPLFVFFKSLIEISALASASDGKMLQIELESLKKQIHEEVNLNDAGKTRLEAFAISLWENQNTQQGALRRLSKLSEKEKRSACNTAIEAILADGHVDPKEVKFLEKLYKAFSMPADDIYAALHRGKSNDEALATIQFATDEIGVSIPPKPTRRSLELDMGRLKRIKAETADVSILLSGIFSGENDGNDVVAVNKQTSHHGVYKNLDMAHSELLDILIVRKSISRKEYDEVVKSLNLLPEGAAETINEWSFDVLDESMIELGDTVSISDEHIEKIRSEFAA